MGVTFQQALELLPIYEAYMARLEDMGSRADASLATLQQAKQVGGSRCRWLVLACVQQQPDVSEDAALRVWRGKVPRSLCAAWREPQATSPEAIASLTLPLGVAWQAVAVPALSAFHQLSRLLFSSCRSWVCSWWIRRH